MSKEVIEPGKYVELVFDLYKVGADGSEELVHQVTDDAPECIIFGVTQGVIRPLEQKLEGLSAGDSYDVVAGPDDAFGRHNPDEVVELAREIFEVDGKFDTEMIHRGAYLPMMTAEGYHIVGRVIDVTAKSVKMDFNHQLVDCTVRIRGTVKTVREATEDDLRPAGCGCGGCGGGKGDGCGCGGSDEGCGCSSKGCGCN